MADFDMANRKPDSKDSAPKEDSDKSGKPPVRGDHGSIRPLKRKVPEGDANLQRREEWFQKRAGSKSGG